MLVSRTVAGCGAAGCDKLQCSSASPAEVLPLAPEGAGEDGLPRQHVNDGSDCLRGKIETAKSLQTEQLKPPMRSYPEKTTDEPNDASLLHGVWELSRVATPCQQHDSEGED